MGEESIKSMMIKAWGFIILGCIFLCVGLIVMTHGISVVINFDGQYDYPSAKESGIFVVLFSLLFIFSSTIFIIVGTKELKRIKLFKNKYLC